MAAEAKKTLVDLRDDITYLRVKLRRDGAVSRDDYGDVRDRLDGLSRKVRGEQRVYAQTPGAETTSRFFTVPVGTEMDVRLQTPLNSGTARVEQRFEATTMVDLAQGKDVVIPAGSVVRGFVARSGLRARSIRRVASPSR